MKIDKRVTQLSKVHVITFSLTFCATFWPMFIAGKLPYASVRPVARADFIEVRTLNNTFIHE